MDYTDELEKLEKEIFLLNKIQAFFKTNEGMYLTEIFTNIKDNRLNDLLSSNRENLQKAQGEVLAWTDLVKLINDNELNDYSLSRQSRIVQITDQLDIDNPNI